MPRSCSVIQSERRSDPNFLVMENLSKFKPKALWLSIFLVIPASQYEPLNLPCLTIRHVVLTAHNELLESTVGWARPPIKVEHYMFGSLNSHRLEI